MQKTFEEKQSGVLIAPQRLCILLGAKTLKALITPGASSRQSRPTHWLP
ncbi:hypothetical protein G7B40_038535 [Aetokthonos hydrillicola Thurmond2011]|uniref:Uncharacterized protein n=1 Tax=Aetokthonos hydrillicola Thurmond2011 TaxID=2712845 RepID=A0AAP5IFP7_9CYAN|nr:hypothetical protein [Aetokthonos hydrillicola CCALA 1050]MDR9900404.1 hypothetical protein [Aetokthonos hydrillicola Thurmond2011]